ncbi:DUF6011 domain-containing protein [Nitratireductor sp. OM-1]|uniref:DUF6011 domain-containing protein n=1 Tax=Nitratireductor sp. OM-1 TaxID=1756988 RepID=UPI000DDF4E63|nr:DUF6011 domain-containing protein [Nitratireductor sp. OM-1]
MNTQIENLKAALPRVPARQQDFAGSLIHQFERKGDLSNKQWYWVQKLAEDAEFAGVPDFTKETETVGQMHGLIKLFETAKEHLKYPAIALQLPDGGPYGSNVWYGRVSPDGVWQKSGAVESDLAMSRKVQTLLKALSADPAGTASAYGKLTGHCCFCRRKLEDEKSTAVGYGPVCAKHYNLPYGSKVSAFNCN